MKAFSTRFFLSLCMLILSGYSPLYAHAYDGAIRYSSTPSETVAHTCADAEQKCSSLIIKPASSDKKEVLKIDVPEACEQEEDDEEFSSLKRDHKKANHLAAILGDQTLRCFYTGSISSFYHYASYTPSYRYLLLQVFRI